MSVSEWRVRGFACACGATFEKAVKNGGSPPTAGDFTMCMACGQLYVRAGDGALVVLTDADIATFPEATQASIFKVQAAWEKYKKFAVLA